MISFEDFSPLKKNIVQVVVETPKGSQHKYSFDQQLRLFRLKKTLPMGLAFPFDFGFIPNTRGGDNDPLDVLIFMEEPAYPGCLVDCRVIGALVCNQKEPGHKVIRNDRIVGVSSSSILFSGLKSARQLGKQLGQEIKDFFIDYNKREGRLFLPVRFEGAEHAISLIRRSIYQP